MKTYDVNKVTPRPWGADRLEVVCRAPNLSASVATTYNRHETDAAHIVHCVNMHDELVAALALAESAMNYMGAELDEIGATATPEALKVTAPAFDAVRAALARARGER